MTPTEDRMINDRRPIRRVRLAYLHLPIKLIPLHFPCFDYACCQACPPGYLTFRNVTLTEVEKKLTEGRIFN